MLLPDKAGVYLCGIEDAKYKEEKIHFWDRVYGFDMSCVKGAAMFEPLVDTVDPQQICTSTSTLWEVDLLTVTQAEMRFDSKFQLQAVRNDYLHAVVAWFDVGFTQGHTPLWLSTSPRDRPTHWRQTVLYLHDVLTVRAGERVSGELRVSPTKRNKRHLDFRLKYAFGRGGGERRAGRERQRHPLLLDALSAPARPAVPRRRIARAPRGAAQAHRARARRSGARGAVFPPSVTLLFCTGVRAASGRPLALYRFAPTFDYTFNLTRPPVSLRTRPPCAFWPAQRSASRAEGRAEHLHALPPHLGEQRGKRVAAVGARRQVPQLAGARRPGKCIQSFRRRDAGQR